MQITSRRPSSNLFFANLCATIDFIAISVLPIMQHTCKCISPLNRAIVKLFRDRCNAIKSLVGVRVRDFVAILTRFSRRFWHDSHPESCQNRVVALTTPSDRPILGAIHPSGLRHGHPCCIPTVCLQPIAYVFCQNKYNPVVFCLPIAFA